MSDARRSPPKLVSPPSIGDRDTKLAPGNDLPGGASGARPVDSARLEFLECLGAGGMGEVWKARDRVLQRLVAVKRLRPEVAARRDLVQEAVAAGQLNHPHIVQVYRLDRDAQPEFLEMEFVEGLTLAKLLSGREPLPVDEAVPLILSICDALIAAHAKNILHRDIKPGNILIGADGRPRLMDFGLAHVELRSSGEATQTGAVLGTPDYMAPEQRRGAEHATAASDQWSLAGVLYEMVTGERPTYLDLDAVPEDLRPILRRGLRRQPEKRFPSVTEFRQALAGLVVAQAPLTVSGTDLADVVVETQRRVRQRHDDARRLVEQQHDYRRAVEVLAPVPEHLREASLYQRALTCRDRVAQLEPEIQRRAKEVRLAGLRALVQELLDLQPERADMRKLLETLPPSPPLLRAPFSPEQARAAQEAWAAHLGQPLEFVHPAGGKMRLLPPGEFLMGAPDGEAGAGDDEKPQHDVRIPRAFWIGVSAVTQAEYRAVTGTNPSYFCSDGGGKETVKGMDTARFPVERVSWEDAVNYCQALTERDAASGRRYRLPTEAEWEFACRAGTVTPFHFGRELNGKQANCNGNYPYGTANKGPYLARPCPVGSYPPNAFGLYDVHGNVWEWVQDWYDAASYRQCASDIIEDPLGHQSGSSRVVRGGSWNNDASDCRSARRDHYDPSDRYSNIGFRLVVSWG